MHVCISAPQIRHDGSPNPEGGSVSAFSVVLVTGTVFADILELHWRTEYGKDEDWD